MLSFVIVMNPRFVKNLKQTIVKSIMYGVKIPFHLFIIIFKVPGTMGLWLTGIIKTDFFGTRAARAGLPWAGVAMQICCWVHLIFLSLFCLFFMNVEVVTRLVWSSSPLIYIFGFQVLQRGQSCPVRLTVITYCQ